MHRSLALLVILALALPTVIAVSQDYIQLIRPESLLNADGTTNSTEYLSSEDLVFLAHVEKTDTVNASLRCLDRTNLTILPVRSFGNYSYVSSFDLERTQCAEIQIQVEFERNDEIQKLTQDITVRKYSSVPKNILDYQYDDGGWETPVSTAYGIWALKNYKSVYAFQIAQAMNWLKDNRHNTLKCWPKASCKIRDTAKVYGLLSDAGYNTSYRIMHDAKIWLEDQLNYMHPNVWSYQINTSYNYTSCVVAFNDTNLTLTMNDNASRRWFNASYGEEIRFICTDAVNISILNNESYRVFTNRTSNISYELPKLCWAENKQWQYCDIESTLFAVLGNIDSTQKKYGQAWLYSYLAEEDNIPGHYLNSTYPYIYTPIYLYVNQSRTDLRDWVLYRQNNDGSWGTGSATNRLLPTAYSIMALEKTGYNHSEFIADGKKWIYTNELKTGWSNIEKNALSFRTLEGYTRYYLKSKPSVIVIDQPLVEVDIYNPTTYNLETLQFALSDNIDDKVVLNAVSELDYDSYKKITFIYNDTSPGDYYGYLSILSGTTEIAIVPVVITRPASLSIKAPSKVSVFGKKGTVDFTITKSAGSFACKLAWDQPAITSAADFTIESQAKLPVEITISDEKRQQIAASGRFTCTISGKSYPILFSFNIEQYTGAPFSVNPTSIALVRVGEDGQFTVTNNLSEDLDVTVAFSSEENLFEISNAAFRLGPDEKKNITIINLVPEGTNATSDNTISVKALGVEKQIRFQANVGMISSSGILGGGISTTMLIIILACVAAGGFAVWWFRKQIVAFLAKYLGPYLGKLRAKLPPKFQKFVPVFAAQAKIVSKGAVQPTKADAKAAKQVAVVDEFGRAHVDSHLIDLIRIMRKMGKEDDVIKTKLQKQGFPDQEIADTFSVLEKLEAKEESLDREKNIIKIMETLEKDRDSVIKKLKEKGFTEERIEGAFKEIEDEARDKEQKLEKQEQPQPDVEEKDKKKKGKKESKKDEKKEEKKKE